MKIPHLDKMFTMQIPDFDLSKSDPMYLVDILHSRSGMYRHSGRMMVYSVNGDHVIHTQYTSRVHAIYKVNPDGVVIDSWVRPYYDPLQPGLIPHLERTYG